MMATLKKNLNIERPSKEQLATFMTFFKHHYKILTDKSFQNTKFAHRCWEELAAILNEMDGPTKSAVRWKDTLITWKKSMRLRKQKRKESIKASPKTDSFIDVDLSGDCRDSSVTTLTAKTPYSYMAKLGSATKTLPYRDKYDLNSSSAKSFPKNNTVSKDVNTTERGDTKSKKHMPPNINKWRKVYSDFVYCELARYSDVDAQRLKNKLTVVCLNFIPQDDYSGNPSQTK